MALSIEEFIAKWWYFKPIGTKDMKAEMKADLEEMMKDAGKKGAWETHVAKDNARAQGF